MISITNDKYYCDGVDGKHHDTIELDPATDIRYAQNRKFCRKCNKSRGQIYDKDNIERKEKAKQRRLDNIDRYKAHDRAYYLKHQEHKKAWQRNYRAEDPEKSRSSCLRSYYKNREKYRAAHRAYQKHRYATDPDYVARTKAHANFRREDKRVGIEQQQ